LPNIKVHAYFAPVTPPVGGIIAGMFVIPRYIDVFIQSALDNTEFSEENL
jgi:hypothetical protein